jgi:hypothetical protein
LFNPVHNLKATVFQCSAGYYGAAPKPKINQSHGIKRALKYHLFSENFLKAKARDIDRWQATPA